MHVLRLRWRLRQKSSSVKRQNVSAIASVQNKQEKQNFPFSCACVPTLRWSRLYSVKSQINNKNNYMILPFCRFTGLFVFSLRWKSFVSAWNVRCFCSPNCLYKMLQNKIHARSFVQHKLILYCWHSIPLFELAFLYVKCVLDLSHTAYWKIGTTGKCYI